MAGRRSASNPIGPTTNPFGSVQDLNGLQTGLLPELSKRTPSDLIWTLTDSALNFQVQLDLLRVRYGSDKVHAGALDESVHFARPLSDPFGRIF